MADEPYANIRQILGHYIGRTVTDITQHDKEEFDEEGECYVMLHFDDGKTLKFDITQDGGFEGHDPTDPED